MPKKLDSIREKAIALTRHVLQHRGYDALAMREIAAGCGIAVGTMYNYFPSKEYLTGCVVLEDWQLAQLEMARLADGADSVEQGLQSVYEMMRRFVEEHRYLTAYDRRKATGEYEFSGRHAMLRQQLETLLQQLQARFQGALEPPILTFLAESILNCSVQGYAYPQVAPAFIKLLK